MNRPLVSFAITVKDEVEDFRNLIDALRQMLSNVTYRYEIVVLVDGVASPGSAGDIAYLAQPFVSRVVFDSFGGDFAAWKNRLSDLCSGEYIFQLDADELPPERVVLTLDYILSRFPHIDLFYLSRLNVVSGITPEDLASWGWKQTIVRGCDVPVINFPDFQGRLFRNSPEIRWVRPVHEAISGNVTYAYLPVTAEHSILHIKSIERQREQNARYHLLMRERAGQS